MKILLLYVLATSVSTNTSITISLQQQKPVKLYHFPYFHERKRS